MTIRHKLRDSETICNPPTYAVGELPLFLGELYGLRLHAIHTGVVYFELLELDEDTAHWRTTRLGVPYAYASVVWLDDMQACMVAAHHYLVRYCHYDSEAGYVVKGQLSAPKPRGER